MSNTFFANRVSSLKGSAIREMFKLLARPGIISFAGGAPAGELFPTGELAVIAENILREKGTAALQYGVTEGYTPLREFVKTRMKNQKVLTDGNDLIITSGGQQALDLAFKSLINEGDNVICEEPSFIGGLNSLRSYGANLIGIPVLDDGLDISKLEKTLEKVKIKLVYTITTFQNPSGITMSAEKRARLLALASKYDFYILEDNPYGELRFSGKEVPAVKSLDREGRVIYAGSFSKILSAGMRIGFAVAREDILEKMIICKQVSDVHSPLLTQMSAADFFQSYSLDEHIDKSCKLYGARCKAMISAMEKYFPAGVSFTRPEGGIFLWCTLPEGTDAGKLLKKAIEQNVAFVPGAACNVNMEAPSDQFRLNYSLPDEEKIEKGIKILGDVIQNELKG
jgi:2-aminoadipate transaminase